MFTFIKNNISSVSKLLANQFGMIIFGLVVLIATRLINPVLFNICGILTIVLYLFLLYIVMWEKGASDKIKVDYGRIKENRLFGLYISLITNSLKILLGLVILILSFFTTAEESAVNSVFSTLKIIATYLNSIYLSVLSINGITPLIYLIVAIPTLTVCFISYILGLKGYRCLIPDKSHK